MAFSSSCSSSCRPSGYNVFLNFYGPDVRNPFVSRLRQKLRQNKITTFEDEAIERIESVDHAHIQAIRESKISIVVISGNYASSKWCLNDLLEILKCKEELNQIVMTVFSGVDASDVRRQKGEFGLKFEKMSAGNAKDQSQNWRQALNDVAQISGYLSYNWADDAALIEKILSDVSNKLQIANSKDFEHMGLTAHLEEKQSLLHLENEDEAMRREQVLRDGYEPQFRVRKSTSRCFTAMGFLVVMNLVTEIASVASDQLSSNRKPYFSRISLAMSILSVVFSIFDLSCKIREQRARFRCKWPIPWFYYPSRGYRRIFGSYMDTVLLFCVLGGLIVSTVNYRFIHTGQDGPITSSIWPLFFAIGMVVSKFLEKPINSNTTDRDMYDSMV